MGTRSISLSGCCCLCPSISISICKAIITWSCLCHYTWKMEECCANGSLLEQDLIGFAFLVKVLLKVTLCLSPGPSFCDIYSTFLLVICEGRKKVHLWQASNRSFTNCSRSVATIFVPMTRAAELGIALFPFCNKILLWTESFSSLVILDCRNPWPFLGYKSNWWPSSNHGNRRLCLSD